MPVKKILACFSYFRRQVQKETVMKMKMIISKYCKTLYINRTGFTFLIILLITAGCEYEKIPAPIPPHVAAGTNYLKSVYTNTNSVSINSTVWKNADYFEVPLSDLETQNIDSEDGLLNSNGTYSGLKSFNNGDSIKLVLRSVYNDSNLFILAEWKDATLDASGREWLYNGPVDPRKSDDSSKWTKQRNDDKLTIKFNFPQGQEYSSDVWMWSISKSEPLGYGIDMAEKNNMLINDPGIPMFAANGNGNRVGPKYEFNGISQIITRSDSSKAQLDAGYFLYNKTEFTGDPENGFVLFKNNCAECHGIKADGENEIGYDAPALNRPWFNATSRATIKENVINPTVHGDGYSHAKDIEDKLDDVIAWLRGQAGLPSNYIQKPSGSIADVTSVSDRLLGSILKDNKTGYKVLLKRKLKNSNTDDFQFNTLAGDTININISLSNNDSINYVGAINQKLIFKKTWDE